MTRTPGAARFLPVLAILLAAAAAAQQPSAPPPPSPTSTPEGLVAEFYRTVSWKAGETADWAKVRSLFFPNAAIFLRTSRTASAAFTVEGFIDDFVTFANRDEVRKNGFGERIVTMRPTVFRDIAQILVLYEAQIPNSPRGPQQGVDSFQLVKTEGRWWILGIANDIVTAENPVPPALRN
ncbi:MAG TPA: hypothetical protein VL084_01820 [Thermoanaerobaculia bacterium]|nr:hypothetical protein [Thermoanaerobaculia bacterium]